LRTFVVGVGVQLEESKRSQDQYRDAVDQLETTIKTFSRQAEEAVSQPPHMSLRPRNTYKLLEKP